MYNLHEKRFPVTRQETRASQRLSQDQGRRQGCCDSNITTVMIRLYNSSPSGNQMSGKSLNVKVRWSLGINKFLERVATVVTKSPTTG